MSQNIEITGKCKWAKVQSPDTQYTPCWSIDMILETDVAQELEKLGIPVKTDKDGDMIIKVKRNVTAKSGKPNDPPEVVDSAGNPFSSMIGNGSTVTVGMAVFDWTHAGKTGVTCFLNKVTVVDLVEFGGDTLSFGKVPASVGLFD